MANYHATSNNSTANLHSPYGAGDPYYDQSSGYITPAAAAKKSGGVSKWIKFGLPLLILVIVGAVVGGVLGSRKSDTTSAAAVASSSAAAASSAALAIATGRFATATNSYYMIPVYPAVTNTAVFTTPTFNASESNLAWPSDTWSPAASPAPTSVRPDRPRLIAPAYKWTALTEHIPNNPYLKGWNDTIFGNASEWYSMEPVPYVYDGGNGILDIARAIKQRSKVFSYAYRMTNDTKWADRLWLELQNAAGNYTTAFGNDTVDRWNSAHFLDTAELSAAFGIAYDWLYDVWTDSQKEQIRWTLNQYGLSFGVQAYNNASTFIGWWKTNTTGNWNCVCNGGLTLGSLAILGDDTTGNAQTLLGLTVDNALQNCAEAITDDGTWSETPDYWYFGTTGHAEMTSALQTATGSDYGMLTADSGYKFTGNFHMYVQGATSQFAFGDTGPNKFSATANPLIFYSAQYNDPKLALFQRDQFDAADPWSMFWYDATVDGAFWDGLPLDSFFDNELDQWVSMRSSWTDANATYVGMKAGMNQGRQTHNDLDVGDFVIDAIGERWAGELGDGNYNAPDYFSNDTQGSYRWYYYRKATEGQNTILVNKTNQNVLARPTILSSGSTNETQGSSTVYDVPSDSTAYWVADMSSAYFDDVSSAKRGVRFINARKQILVQDEITTTNPFQWRMHTNATVTIDSSGTKATLTLRGKTMEVDILSPSSGASFTTQEAVRFDTDPIPPEADQPNDGVTVLTIALDAGTYNIQVLFNPQWSDGTQLVTPPSVDLANWSLTSHNSS